MRKPSILRFSAAVLLSLGLWVAYTQNQPAAAQLTIEKVKDDLYVIVGDGGNVAVQVTSEGVILIDDKFERDHAQITAHVKSVSDKPIRYVLNTHQHGDHTGGNEKLIGSAEIIAHRNARANMAAGKMPGVPRVSFSEETEVFLGGKEVRARHFGRGHTNGDAVIYFPADKTIHMGDLLTGGSPFIDYSSKGSVVEWTKTIDGVLASGWDFDTVIPGHGKVMKRDDLVQYKAGIEKMRTRVSSLIREGKGKDDIAKVLVADFGWTGTGLGMRSLEPMIAELKN
jgi:cyclase